MAIYRYVKKEPKTSRVQNLKYFQIFSLSCLCLSFIILLSAFWPILNYQIKSRGFVPKLVSPVPVLGDSTTLIDYSKPATWFPTAVKSVDNRASKITHYSLSIPKLKIEDAVVQVGGKDLMESLVHYPGTSLPGQYGNAVVFGHSVLPQFYNPKNYRTIFSTLPTLKEGDEVFINFDGVLYRYEVIGLKEVSPDDVSVLEQHYDSEYLTLITCAPPGTYLKRLIISLKLTKI